MALPHPPHLQLRKLLVRAMRPMCHVTKRRLRASDLAQRVLHLLTERAPLRLGRLDRIGPHAVRAAGDVLELVHLAGGKAGDGV